MMKKVALIMGMLVAMLAGPVAGGYIPLALAAIGVAGGAILATALFAMATTKQPLTHHALSGSSFL